MIEMATTIRVSKETAKILEAEKRKMGAKSVEEVILKLLKEKRAGIVEKYFGIDRGKISEFKEDDRLDTRV